MSISIEHVYEAIAAFNSQNPEASMTAAQWLGQFQKSFDAWIIADKIITEANTYEAMVFAAQTIRQKILFDFSELSANPGSYDSLRNSIINHLRTVESKVAQNHSTIITQLAAGLADLYLQVPQWNNFIGEMLQELSQSGTVLLTMFKIFPEEIYNRHLRVGENRRSAVEEELAEKTDVVIQSLSHLCEIHSSDNAMQTKAISCFASWIMNKRCPTNTLAQCQLLNSVLYAVRLPDCPNNVHDAACECIVNALFLVDDVKKHEELAKMLQTGVYNTLDGFKAAVAEEDSEKLQNYARIYCELCETLLAQIASEPGRGFGDLRSLDMLLCVLDYHDYTLAEMTFNVWYRLSEFLYQAEDYDFDELRIVFRPYIARYIECLYKHCRLEADMQGVMTVDSDIAMFREKAAESIKDVTFIIGSTDLLKNMMNLLNSKSNGTWDEMESALFIISCVIHNVIETESEVIPVLLNAVFNFQPTTHPMLLNTTAQLIGNLGDWLLANPNYLVLAAPWLISLASKNISLIKTLAESLEKICEKGYRNLHEYFDTVYELILNIENVPTDGQRMENASHHLLRACAHLINDLPANEINVRLERLCTHPIEFLTKIVSSPAGENSFNQENLPDSWKRLSNDPVLWLDRVAAIYRVLKPWQSQSSFKAQNGITNGNNGNPEAPWLALSIRVWRVVSATLEHFKSNLRVAEHACRAIRFLIRSMGIQSIIFIEELAHQMMSVYNEYQHSCILYLASIVVDEYGNVDHIQDGLITMMNTLAQRSFGLLQGENGFREHPDTVDDLYRLAIRFVQRSPQKFICQPIFDTLFNGAIVGLELDHVDANRSVTKFILETIDIARKARNNISPDAERIVLKYGGQMIWHCLNASLFHISNSLRKEMSEIVFAVGQYSKERQTEWMASAIQNLPHDSGLSATRQQLLDFNEKVTGARKQFEVLTCIRDLSKYYA